MFDLILSNKMSVVQYRAIAAKLEGDERTPSRARINAAVNGTEPFNGKDTETTKLLQGVTGDLVALQREFPVPIDFSKFEEIAELIRERRKAREAQIARFWFVFRTVDGYFVKCDNGQVVATSDVSKAAATQKVDIAIEVEKQLKTMGVRVNRILMNGGSRSMSEMLTNLSEFGFAPAAVGAEQ